MFPWPPAENESPVEALGRTWSGVMFNPASFFREMPEEAPAGPAILYALILSVAAAAVRMFWSFVLPAGAAITADTTPAELLKHPFQLMFSSGHITLTQFLLAPVYVLFGILISTCVIQVVMMMLVPTRGPFERTMRMVCYTQSTAIFAIIPFLGGIIGSIWGLFVIVIAVREVNRTTTGRAAATVLLPGGCIMVFLAFAVGILMAVMGSGFMSQISKMPH